MNDDNKNIIVAIIGAIAVVLAAVIGNFKCSSDEPAKSEQKQEVTITNQPIINISIDSTNISQQNTTIVGSSDKKEESHPHILSTPSVKKVVKKDFKKYIEKGEYFLNNVRGNEKKIHDWKRNAIAFLQSINPQTQIEYNNFELQYEKNPPEKNIVETILLMLKTAEESASN